MFWTCLLTSPILCCSSTKYKSKLYAFRNAKDALPIISTSLNLGFMLRSGDEWDTASVLMCSLSFFDKINGRTQATQQSEKNILSKNNTSRSNSISWNWPLSSSCLHITSFFCLLLPDGLPPSRGKKSLLSGSFMHLLFYTPCLSKAAEVSQILQYC